MIQFRMTKQELDSYPVAPLGDKNKEAQVNYVLAIIDGDSKEEAYAQFFPERYAKVKGDKHRTRNAIYALEQGEYVQKMMSTANKQAYSRFFGKVNNVLQKVYDRAVSDDVDDMVALRAAEVFMRNVPKAQEDIVIKHEIDIKDQYKQFLSDRKKFMTELANGSNIIDIEVIDEGKE